MNKYLVVCDLNRILEKGTELSKVISNFVKFDLVFNEVTNVWIFASNHDIVEIRDLLTNTLSEKDHVLVFKIDSIAAWNTDSQESSDKIKSILLAD